MKQEFDQWGPELVLNVFDPDLGMSGFLVIDNTVLGPGKGGFRMTPHVSKEEVRRLARAMTFKNSLAGLPFGGAKGGILWSGGDEALKKKFVQSFARAIAPYTPKRYIAGPDISTGEKEMQWFVEATGNWRSATGKPAKLCMLMFGKGGAVEQCGIPHEFGSTGFGVAWASKVAAKATGLDLKGAAVAIHGFGNVGSFTYSVLTDMGARVVAIADKDGALYAKDGFDKRQMNTLINKRASIIQYKGAERISGKKFWGLPVDILIPASVTDVINEENKNTIKAKIIVEGANIPMREHIEEELYQKGVLIVPDIVANAGGVISSYAEWRGYNPKRMFDTVRKKIVRATEAVVERSLREKQNPRTVALQIAEERIARETRKKP